MQDGLYGGSRMFFVPLIEYNKTMKQIPKCKTITVGAIRYFFARINAYTDGGVKNG